MNQKQLTKKFMMISNWKKTSQGLNERIQRFNPFKPEFTIFIFIHYKPCVAILDL